MEVRLFNETFTDTRNAYLTPSNEILDVEITGVNWGHPSGCFRTNSEVTVTHLVAFFNNKPYVYKVTNFLVINGNVIEYYYDVDYFKTYFYRHQFTHLFNARVLRSWNAADWASFINDEDRPLSGHISMTHYSGNKINNQYVCVIHNTVSNGSTSVPFSACTVDIMSYAGYILLCQKFLSEQNSQLAYSQITDCFSFPFNGSITDILDSMGASYTTDTKFYFWSSTGGSYETWDLGGVLGTIYHAHFDYSSNITNTITIQSGLILGATNYTDLPPISRYVMKIPFYGTKEISSDVIQHSPNTGIEVNYRYSFLDGTVSVGFNDDVGSYSEYIPLPRLSIPCSDAILQMQLTKNDYGTAKYANQKQLDIMSLSNYAAFSKAAVNTVAGSAERLLSGYLPGLMRDVGEFANGYIDYNTNETNNIRSFDIVSAYANNNYNNGMLQALNGGLTVGATGGCDIDLIFEATKYSGLYVNQLNIDGLIDGYVCNKPLINCSYMDSKILLYCSNCVFPDELEKACADIERRYIFGNSGGLYSTYSNGTWTEHNTQRPHQQSPFRSFDTKYIVINTQSASHVQGGGSSSAIGTSLLDFSNTGRTPLSQNSYIESVLTSGQDGNIPVVNIDLYYADSVVLPETSDSAYNVAVPISIKTGGGSYSDYSKNFITFYPPTDENVITVTFSAEIYKTTIIGSTFTTDTIPPTPSLWLKHYDSPTQYNIDGSWTEQGDKWIFVGTCTLYAQPYYLNYVWLDMQFSGTTPYVGSSARFMNNSSTISPIGKIQLLFTSSAE